MQFEEQLNQTVFAGADPAGDVSAFGEQDDVSPRGQKRQQAPKDESVARGFCRSTGTPPKAPMRLRTTGRRNSSTLAI